MEKRNDWVKKLFRPYTELPMVEDIDPEKYPMLQQGGSIAFPTPYDVQATMDLVPKGKLITTEMIEAVLADKFDATVACPMCTAMFSMVTAYIAEEERLGGEENVTPWWRTIRPNGKLDREWPGDGAIQRQMLAKEGIEVIEKNGELIVPDFEHKLFELGKIHVS